VQHKYTIVYYQAETRGLVGYVEEVPGANTQADTEEEMEERLREAVRLVFEANREILAKRLPARRLFRKDLFVDFD
jgi:predicted RNase H-like HicB family nuclease